MLKRIGAIAVAGIAATTMVGGSVQAIAAGLPSSDNAVAKESIEGIGAQVAKTLAVVEGQFAFDQTTLSSKSEIQRALAGSPQYMCDSQLAATVSEGATSSLNWPMTVGGSVQKEYVATLGEMTDEVGEATVSMGCSCMGNPAGGLSTVNAEVTGITLASLIELVGVDENANTVVFTSEDGYKVALPLRYVTTRPCVIAYSINGGDIQESVGGSNQLWIGTTSAKYFARNITDITFEVRDEAPPTPGTPEAGDMYKNIPGIGVTEGAVA